MASLIVRKLTTNVVDIEDLGISFTGAIGVDFDLLAEQANDVSLSGDLIDAINGTGSFSPTKEIIVLDPRDGTTVLSEADSVLVIQNSNLPHFGVSGGRFAAADDPANVFLEDYILTYNLSTDSWDPLPHSHLFNAQSNDLALVIASMGIDGVDSTYVHTPTNTFVVDGQDETVYDNDTDLVHGTFNGIASAGSYAVSDVITLSDGSTVTVDAVSGSDVTDFTVTTSGETNVTAGVALTQTGVLPANGQTGFTLTPEQANITPGTMQWDVDDVFLRNTGDTLDSGTLSIASGATVSFAAGSSLTIDTAVTAATITTPAGGFTGDSDLINKEYVDAVAAGLDWKESVRIATTPADGSLGSPVATQDETVYDGAGSNGTFSGGSAWVSPGDVGLTITLSDGTIVTIDAVVAGAVTEFTVTTAGTNNTAGTVLTQASTTGGGTAFTLTPGTANIAGLYDPTGGVSATGDITGLDLSSGTGITLDGLNFTGVFGTGLVIGDRVLIKDQADAKQNGVYEISAGSIATSVTLTRATDQDGTPASEVSAGNASYVEDTTAINASSVNSTTAWVVTGDGILTLNTDNIDWVQFAGTNTILAGIAMSNDGLTYDVDVDDASTAAAVVGDSIIFHDANGTPAASGSQTRKTTFSSLFNELDVVNGITANGIIVRTANDTYASRTLTVSGAGPLDGLAVTNGDGVAGNPVVGLDIQNMTVRAAVDGVNDRVAVWDSSLNTNVYYTVNDIAGAASASNSFETWARSGNGTGGPLVADSATDTVTLDGGIGTTLTMTAGSDTISFAFSNAGMADTAVVGADTFPFFDSGNANEPEFRSFTNLISDLALQTSAYTTINGDTGSASASGADTLALVGGTNGGITTVASEPGTDQVAFSVTPIDLTTGAATLATGDFIIVSDSTDTATTVALKYTFSDMITDLGLLTAVTAATAEDLTGINVTGGSVIGLDIVGLTAAGDDMAATDEFPLHDKSEGTAGANGKITGQDIADGVSTILGLPTLSTINGQPIWTYVESTRTKTLSIESNTYTFSDNDLDHLEWVDIGNAVDADSGHVMPFNGTVVAITAHCENTDASATKAIHLFRDTVDEGTLGTLGPGANTELTDVTIDINFAQGEKLRLRALDGVAGKLKDTVINLLVRWRA